MSIASDYLLKLLKEGRLSEFSKLQGCWFHEHDNYLFNLVTNHVTRFGSLPHIDTILEESGLSFEDNEPLDYYYQKFRNRVVLTSLSDRLQNINSLMSAGDGDGVFDLLKEVIEEADVNSSIMSKEVLSLRELGDLVLERMREKRASGMTGITTGWKTLDEATGGLQNGNKFVILARVKMGKTLNLLYMANAAYEAGEIPLVASMEMTAEEMGNRIFAMRTSLNMTDLTRGHVSTFAEQRLEHQVTSISDSRPFYYIEGQFQQNIGSLSALIKSIRPTVVYIDGGYLIKPDANLKQQWERVGYVAEKLKTLSIQMGIPVVVTYQFNRNVSRKTKSVESSAFENIGLSDAISQLASTGIAILDDETQLDDRKTVEIIGGRGGEKGKFSINWNWKQMDFSEIDEDELPEDSEVLTW